MTYQVESAPVRTHSGYSDNQICQWYCCACGQSYGSIIYRDHAGSDSTAPAEPAAAAGSSQNLPKSPHNLNHQLLQSLKHYSSLIYNHAPPTTPHTDSNYTTDSPVRSPASVDDSSPFDGPVDNVAVKVPTRFTCHRCDHMMCPYCPKVRVKDLAS